MKNNNAPHKTALPINIYLGGSFDPIHNGHTAMLQHVYQTLKNHTEREVSAYFLPTSRSPLKTGGTDATHRFQMLTLAADTLNKQSSLLNTMTPNSVIMTETLSKSTLVKTHYHICEQEIWQTPPTYTMDTLKVLRSQNLDSSLVFILGADNIANLAQWRESSQLTQFTHFWILPRDEWQSLLDIYNLLPKSLQNQVTDSIDDLKYMTHGRIYIDSQGIAPISSTDIRAAIANHQSNQIKYALPSSVYSYIIENNLYHVP